MPKKNNSHNDEQVKVKCCKSDSSTSSDLEEMKNLNCCVPNECNPDCCTPAFQRLDKLRNQWGLISTGFTSTNTYSVDRNGSLITAPASISYNNPLAYGQATPTTGIITGNNEVQAYYFVNVFRYLNFEACGKRDQVIGWSVNVQTGDLVLYQNLPDLNLTTATSRANLLTYAQTNTTVVIRDQLRNIEGFWKLSLKAVEAVRNDPKEEGNICEIKDKYGNKFLVAINRIQNPVATNQHASNPASSVINFPTQFSIVMVKL